MGGGCASPDEELGEYVRWVGARRRRRGNEEPLAQGAFLCGALPCSAADIRTAAQYPSTSKDGTRQVTASIAFIGDAWCEPDSPAFAAQGDDFQHESSTRFFAATSPPRDIGPGQFAILEGMTIKSMEAWTGKDAIPSLIQQGQLFVLPGTGGRIGMNQASAFARYTAVRSFASSRSNRSANALADRETTTPQRVHMSSTLPASLFADSTAPPTPSPGSSACESPPGSGETASRLGRKRRDVPKFSRRDRLFVRGRMRMGCMSPRWAISS